MTQGVLVYASSGILNEFPEGCERNHLPLETHASELRELEPNVWIWCDNGTFGVWGHSIACMVAYCLESSTGSSHWPLFLTGHFELESFSDWQFCKRHNCRYRRLVYVRKSSILGKPDTVYKGLAHRVLRDASKELRKDRTGTGTYSIFGDQIRFDLSQGAPLLTTKRVPWRSCIHELLWFIGGKTDARLLREQGVTIWDGNSSSEFLNRVGLSHLREGDCGANYSFQWRHFGQSYVDCETAYRKGEIGDQLQNVLNLIRTDPTSRRIFMTAWNPLDLHRTVLPPCHVSVQFYVRDGRLSCHMYQRSCDVFLGLPWNIFSYSVLTELLAKMSGYVSGDLIISFGDVHVYSDHMEQIKEQLKREIYVPPKLIVSDKVVEKTLDEICIDDFDLVGYHSHPSIRGKMSV
jgi:thymidylate synthase